jgi:hypothetical protein
MPSRLRKSLDALALVESPADLLQIERREPLPGYTPARAGRPTHYTPTTAQLVCDMIADGFTMTEIAKCEGMPSRQAVEDWAAIVPAFGVALAHAREKQATAVAERGFAEAWREDLAPQDIARARLRFDAARWLASVIDPARYGSRADLSVTVIDPVAAERAATQRAEIVAALQRLAKAEPLTIEGGRPSD